VTQTNESPDEVELDDEETLADAVAAQPEDDDPESLEGEEVED
jgi:hypothetical protein